MLHHSWDSPRNSHFDLPKLDACEGKKHVPGISAQRGTVPMPSDYPSLYLSFFVFCYSIS